MRNTVRRKQAAFWAVFLIGSALFFVFLFERHSLALFRRDILCTTVTCAFLAAVECSAPTFFFFFFEKLRSMRKVEVRLNLGLELLPAASNFPLLFVIVVQ